LWEVLELVGVADEEDSRLFSVPLADPLTQLGAPEGEASRMLPLDIDGSSVEVSLKTDSRCSPGRKAPVSGCRWRYWSPGKCPWPADSWTESLSAVISEKELTSSEFLLPLAGGLLEKLGGGGGG
jgi:hypothetical protein